MNNVTQGKMEIFVQVGAVFGVCLRDEQGIIGPDVSDVVLLFVAAVVFIAASFILRVLGIF